MLRSAVKLWRRIFLIEENEFLKYSYVRQPVNLK